MHVAAPQLHELDEVLVDDFSTVEALVAGAEGKRNGGHGRFVNGKSEMEAAVSGMKSRVA
jgi:hypothetical protein